MPVKVLRAFFDKIGVQNYDFAINAAALENGEFLEQRLKQVAVNYGKAREARGLTQFDPSNKDWELHGNEWSDGADADDTLAFMRQLLESSVSPEGFQLERSMWNWYQQQKNNPTAPLFNPRQKEALQKRILADFNAATPANRPSAGAANNVLRNILLLQGYPSDLMLKLTNTGLGGARDRKGFAKAKLISAALAPMALMAVLIGAITSAVTGGWEKYIRNRQPSLATPLDADFWTNWKRYGERAFSLGSAQLGYLGDIMLALKGEIVGNRGFDPSGRILGLSLATRALTALRGAYQTYKGAGTAGDALTPLADVGRSMVPFWLEAEHLLGRSMGNVKQSERVLRGEAGAAGLLEGKSGFTPPSYGPTTVVRRNVGDAISKWAEANASGDKVAAAKYLEQAKAELKKLEEYHFRKYTAAGDDPQTARDKAVRDTWNDYQDINPAVAALLGKRPTQAQFDLMLGNINGERRRVVDAGINAWKGGAQEIFGREGSITREQVAEGRGGMGGRGFQIPGAQLARFPAFPNPAGARRSRASVTTEVPAVRAVTSRVRRGAQAGLAGARRTRRASRQRRVQGFRAPAIRRTPGRSRVRRQRSLVRRQRPVYAAA